MTFKMGYRFALEKKEWILLHQKKMNQLAPKQRQILPGDTFNTRQHNIKVDNSGFNNIQIKKEGNTITLFFPKNTPIEADKNQEIIKKFIIEILRKEAKEYLPKRLDLWAEKYGFKYKKVFIKNLKSRWGSCSSQNNINLNVHLMRLPEHLSDFIILHELCHTIHKNHGKDFHGLLERLTGNEKQLNKELKNYSIYF